MRIARPQRVEITGEVIADQRLQQQLLRIDIPVIATDVPFRPG